MGVQASTLNKLVALAREPSSDKRRDLLREVTDMFFQSSDGRSETEAEHFDVILSSVAEEMAVEIRQELAERFASAPDAPRKLIRQLAADDINVAGEILLKSLALDDDDLVSVANTRGQEHLNAIAQRQTVSERVADAVGQRADPNTMATLVSNPGAQLSRATLERAVDQASSSPVLHAPIVDRGAMPDDLLTQMYLFVEERLKEKIRERNIDLSEEALQRALARSPHLKAGRPDDYGEAVAYIRKAKLRQELNAELLVRLMRDGERTRFLVGFAEMAGIDFDAASGVFEDPSSETLAMVCKAAGLSRSLFITLAIARGGNRTQTIGAANEMGRLYDDMPLAVAERVMRFWRMRKQISEGKDSRAA